MVKKLPQKPLVISYLRFSSPEQAKGDSFRRQTANGEKWAAENGLTIDRSLSDQGVSGYSGANVAPTAALGRLLELVRSGSIPKGSILLVESLDRISRQDILEALNIFTTLIKSGLKIVTLADRKEYDVETVTKNPMDLMYSIMVLSRGNEESKIKGMRVSEKWRNKQANAKEKRVTEICPQWLRPTNNGKFEIIPQAKRAIEKAAEMLLNGHTWKSILKELRDNHPKNYGRSGVWTKAMLITIMTNDALIGTYQPKIRKKTNGHRKIAVPIGEPILNYYPSILDGKTFRQIRKLIRGRKNTGGQRENETVNIWGGKMYDVQDFKIYIGDHGSGKRYISSGRENGLSKMPMSPLYEIDKGLIFGLLQHLKLTELKLSDNPQPLYEELVAVEARIKKLGESLRRMTTDPAIVIEAIEELQKTKNEILGKIAEVEKPTNQNGVIETLKAFADIENTDNRRRLAVAISSVVKKVGVYFERQYRDHIISAVFFLVDGSEFDWRFKIEYVKTNVYNLEFLVEDMASVANGLALSNS